MLSGNGRHRRPRQAPALVVAAGVTGSAIAIPLLGATGAHAAGANWDQVAECETGGAWSQNVGNGYYGGLQLPQEAWERYGGLEYAASADQASRSQQIRIAEKLYADQGIAAWPTCGLLAGLGNPPGATAPTGDGASEGSQAPKTSDTPDPAGSAAGSKTPEPTGSPKASDSPESSESSESSDASSPSGSEKETAPTPGASASSPSSSSPSSGSDSSDDSSDGKDQSAKTGTSPESDRRATGEPEAADRSSGSGKHRGDSADEGGRWKGLTDSTSGRHASRDGGSGDADDGSYIVRSGDNLWAIADSLGVDGGWRALYSDNERVVGQDPDRILPGQTLTVTGESGEK
ncbi:MULTISPECIES: transglycosylase family protein [unclassified Streptomyces]|uniref:LysM peptidoglycan-binding domain-containing protein n=1 Tax=unclassified Streptomyces TaxID=2593676 RepID=UPI00278132D9|nr:transglycosylase family protein [Streptomyces sp. DSM 40167]MDQ0404277.1 nucleoid-associated protein YgaU [Streptomyces sp. DSM 40167]